ncbi:hypothetical protein [Pedobacter sp. L105]|uniref:hypothetical protein n=1 Tax=Pedobacter sp. L105 TaxID=1641871 RepID=UPI00131B893E|nr:hypothetical protein [Pedobacter sp. L105]
MKGRDEFTYKQADIIKDLLKSSREVDKAEQKVISFELNQLHQFFISDFTDSRRGFTTDNFDELVSSGKITIKD